jgi:hypothetical protein
VSDDGVIVGLGPDRSPVEFDQLGNVVENLPLPAGYSSGEAVGTTASGSVVVGWAGNGSSCYPMVWQYDSSGWTTGQVIDKSAGFAYGVTKVAGELRVVGRSGGRAVLWTLASGSLTRLELATDQSSASGINGLGTVVAGTRTLPLARDPSRSYDEHVVWVRNDSGGWDLVPLKGADPSFGEGDASGIADQSDGSTIVVGYSWQNTSGTGGTVWAVAWRRAAGAAAFDSPILLPPLNKKSGAVATDINSRGEVVGVSDVGMTRYAVMWKLR